MVTDGFLNDEIVVDPEQLLFRFTDLINRISYLLRQSEPPLVFAIVGEWGTGKSTLMNNLALKLSEDSVIVKYDVWTHQYDMQPWISLVRSIINELIALIEKQKLKLNKNENRKIKNFWDYSTAFLKDRAIDKYPTLGDPDSKWGRISTKTRYRKLRENLKSTQEKLRETYIELVESFYHNSKKRIYVFIDNIDRMDNPSKAIEFLENIKIYLLHKHIIFILATSMTQLKQGLSNKYHDKIPDFNLSQYLSKFIQIQFTIPPLDSELIENFINEKLKEILPSLSIFERNKFSENITYFFQFLNLREIKNLMNNIRLHFNITAEYLGDEKLVDFTLVIKAVLLLHYPLWGEFFTTKFSQDPIILSKLEEEKSGREIFIQLIEEELIRIREENIDEKLIIVGEMNAWLKTSPKFCEIPSKKDRYRYFLVPHPTQAKITGSVTVGTMLPSSIQEKISEKINQFYNQNIDEIRLIQLCSLEGLLIYDTRIESDPILAKAKPDTGRICHLTTAIYSLSEQVVIELGFSIWSEGYYYCINFEGGKFIVLRTERVVLSILLKETERLTELVMKAKELLFGLSDLMNTE